MEKSLYDELSQLANGNKPLVTNTLKALSYNGITDIDILLKMKPEAIMEIKGIGPRSMNLISMWITKERMIRKQKKEKTYICLRDLFEKAGSSRLSAYQMERILKQNGVSDIDIFMKMSPEDFKKMKGIAEKRLLIISKTKQMIKKKQQRDYTK